MYCGLKPLPVCGQDNYTFALALIMGTIVGTRVCELEKVTVSIVKVTDYKKQTLQCLPAVLFSNNYSTKYPYLP